MDDNVPVLAALSPTQQREYHTVPKLGKQRCLFIETGDKDREEVKRGQSDVRKNY